MNGKTRKAKFFRRGFGWALECFCACRPSFSQKGFTLVEIAIAGLMLAGLVVGAVAVQKNGIGGQKALQAEDDSRVLTDGIVSLLTDPTACANTFLGVDPLTGMPGITSIKDGSNSVQFQIGNMYGNHAVSLAGITAGGGGAGAVDTRTNIRKWNPSTTVPGTGTILIQMNWQKGKSASGPANLVRGFLVDATLTGATISSCKAQVGPSQQISIGSGTASYLPAWQDSTTLGDSVIAQSGTNIGVGTSAPNDSLEVNGGITLQNIGDSYFAMNNAASGGSNWAIADLSGPLDSGGMSFYNNTSAAEAMRISTLGHIGIGTNAPVVSLDVSGAFHLPPNSAPPYVCAAEFDGAIAMTNAGTLCSCNGTNWVETSDGTSACGWITPPVPPKPCKLPWSPFTSEPNGTVITAWLTPSGVCTSEFRTCKSGTWDGSYTNENCTTGCVLTSGSASFTATGAATFKVPCYSSLNVTVKGAGGGSAGICYGAALFSANGRAGTLSEFASATPLIGNPGNGARGYGSGAKGGASGGSSNITGGGAPGAPGYLCGSGGAGGMATITWLTGSANAPTVDSMIAITVGKGGAGGPWSGKAGGNGSVSITWH